VSGLQTKLRLTRVVVGGLNSAGLPLPRYRLDVPRGMKEELVKRHPEVARQGFIELDGAQVHFRLTGDEQCR
jgi:hypothetical protein